MEVTAAALPHTLRTAPELGTCVVIVDVDDHNKQAAPLEQRNTTTTQQHNTRGVGCWLHILLSHTYARTHALALTVVVLSLYVLVHSQNCAMVSPELSCGSFFATANDDTDGDDDDDDDNMAVKEARRVASRHDSGGSRGGGQ